MDSVASTSSGSSRKSYTIKQRLDAVSSVVPGVAGKSIRAISKERGMSTKSLRRWIRDEAIMKQLAADGKTKVRVARKLPGSGRKPLFLELEKRLIAWVQDRNTKGLRVKDALIIARAKGIAGDILTEMDVETDGKSRELLRNFQASSNWCARFKNRHNLVSRRHTTTRMLPDGFNDKCVLFINEVQEMTDKYGIKPENIINFDQVPRYFELNMSTTITTKGSKEVPLKAASTSHRRFTFTPFINAAGKIIGLHLLFANLKNKPKVEPDCTVDVNKSGMWSETLIKDVVDKIIVNRRQSLFREPTLVLLDAYGAHLKFVENNKAHYEKANIHFKIIPARLTGLLQPLDVAVNRSFQQAFGDSYDKYVSDALNDDGKRTAAGNIKSPPYIAVSKWVSDWAKSMNPEAISKSFTLCGYTHPELFDLNALHSPLKACFAEDFQEEEWIENNAALMTNNDLVFTLSEEAEFSLHDMLHSILDLDDEFEEWANNLIEQALEAISENGVLSELCDDEDKKRIRKGLVSKSRADTYAFAQLLERTISVTELNHDSSPITTEIYGENERIIELVQLGDKFGAKI